MRSVIVKYQGVEGVKATWDSRAFGAAVWALLETLAPHWHALGSSPNSTQVSRFLLVSYPGGQQEMTQASGCPPSMQEFWIASSNYYGYLSQQLRTCSVSNSLALKMWMFFSILPLHTQTFMNTCVHIQWQYLICCINIYCILHITSYLLKWNFISLHAGPYVAPHR